MQRWEKEVGRRRLRESRERQAWVGVRRLSEGKREQVKCGTEVGVGGAMGQEIEQRR